MNTVPVLHMCLCLCFNSIVWSYIIPKGKRSKPARRRTKAEWCKVNTSPISWAQPAQKNGTTGSMRSGELLMLLKTHGRRLRDVCRGLSWNTWSQEVKTSNKDERDGVCVELFLGWRQFHFLKCQLVARQQIRVKKYSHTQKYINVKRSSFVHI